MPGYEPKIGQEFGEFARELAVEEAPGLFAIVDQYDNEGQVAGYGLEFGDRAEFVTVEGDFRLSGVDAHGIVDLYGRMVDADVRLVPLGKTGGGGS
ncbi:hypothetical protein GCM10022243_23670 [Saccharothrix violaceirubra]|uniref:Uncharacterized protein n=1 Tax=Saccharothrix violaceirubra TaxID=413306 RepID=A0A7W7T891_9PSEU|nr:hypothetical protein [Saccharothrix violaceirubra]MBB4967812.1 hypothetical protein [Saccharothrix violaceirubra]